MVVECYGRICDEVFLFVGVVEGFVLLYNLSLVWVVIVVFVFIELVIVLSVVGIMVYYVVLKLLFVLDIVYVFDDVDFVVVGNLINFILVLYFCE